MRQVLWMGLAMILLLPSVGFASYWRYGYRDYYTGPYVYYSPYSYYRNYRLYPYHPYGYYRPYRYLYGW